MIRIEKIKFMNHAVFNHREINLCSEDGQPASNIILVGENGSGKTILMEEIRKVMSCMAIVNHQVENSVIEIYFRITGSEYTGASDGRVAKRIRVKPEIRDDGTYTLAGITFFDENNIGIQDVMKNSQKINRFKLHAIYSGVDINYKPKNKVSSVTNMTLDDLNSDTNNSLDLAKDIIQLMIDVASDDDSMLASYCREHKETKIPTSLLESQKMTRFNRAFAYIFGNDLRYFKIENNIEPIFKKGDDIISVENLSSGEKQIVFRGIQLLKNINYPEETIAIVDEPEISMHPTWEQKIYGYYKSLFINTDSGSQRSQLIMATHSEHVIAEALSDDDSVIIDISAQSRCQKVFHKDSKGTILPTATLGEIKYQVFHVCSIDFHISLYAYIQNNLSRCKTIERFDKFLLDNNAPMKEYQYKDTTYKTLPTFIRNCIDHPKPEHTYAKEEIEKSIAFMIKLIQEHTAT